MNVLADLRARQKRNGKYETGLVNAMGSVLKMDIDVIYKWGTGIRKGVSGKKKEPTSEG